MVKHLEPRPSPQVKVKRNSNYQKSGPWRASTSSSGRSLLASFVPLYWDATNIISCKEKANRMRSMVSKDSNVLNDKSTQAATWQKRTAPGIPFLTGTFARAGRFSRSHRGKPGYPPAIRWGS